MIGGRLPALVPEILSQSDRIGAKLEQLAAITPKRYEIGCQLLLVTNRKSHEISIGTDLDDLE